MSLGKYAILVFGVLIVTLGLAWPLALRRLDAPGRWAVAFGGLIAVLNTTAAHALLRRAVGRSTAVFLRTLLGGMLGRMALMLGAVLVGVLLLDLPRLPLASSLLSYFVAFLALELSLLHRQAAGVAAAGAR